MMKRISAFLFDFIMRVMLIIGIASILSACFKYDTKVERFDELSEQYVTDFGVDLTEDEYNLLSPDEQNAYKEKYEEANEAFNSNPEVARLSDLIISLTVLITTSSVLVGYLLLEFTVPLFLKNGQTLGKKIFGIGVMRDDGVRISTKMLFVRSILGKCTIEALVPIAIVLLVFIGNAGSIGLITLVLLGGLEIFLMVKTKTNSCIHDLLAYAVTVDMASQMIFDSEEALMEYKNRIHKEMSERADY
jgi:uncharacterized RDD family membrane protein YckC